jgi:thymidylate synthase
MPNRKEGIMGPLYGFQHRFFGALYDEETGKPIGSSIDQLQYVLDLIKNDPSSRRIIMTNYNPSQASQGVLFPCHSIIIQFYVQNNHLDMFCYNRSQDLFLGTPFNIASSALFLTLIAKASGLIPRHLHMSLGDIHIYKPHYDKVQEQLTRHPYTFPTLLVDLKTDSIKELENLSQDNFYLVDYNFYPSIKAEMIA